MELNAERFEAAAEKIDRRGLTKGSYYDKLDPAESSYCTMGAVLPYTLDEWGQIVNIQTDDIGEVAELIFKANPDISHGSSSSESDYASIFEWNDHEARTKADVYNALMNTAKMLRDEGK